MSFYGAKVLSFESRRAHEIGELIRLHGGDPLVAPAVAEVPLEHNEAAFQFAKRLGAGEFDMMIFLTGVGARLLRDTLAARGLGDGFVNDLRKLAVVVRGPKPSAVMREWNVPVAVFVPEPNTWRELLKSIAGRPEKSVAVQEYGRRNSELIDGLSQQGRRVSTVEVYQWALPSDTAPLRRGLDELIHGQVRVVLFTTSIQVEHLLRFAESEGLREAAIAALSRKFICSIGPTCSEALVEHGLQAAMEPSHPKMGLLVREAAERMPAS